MTECYNCGKSGATNSVTINNSDADNRPSDLTDEDVSFDVDFSGAGNDPDLRVVTVTLCDGCKSDINY